MIREVSPGGGDFFFSHYSISSALSLAAVGAQGSTQLEMNRILSVSGVDALKASGLAGRELIRAAEASGMTFRTSNALWRQQGLPLLPAYVAVVQDNFASALEETDFVASPDNARVRINAAISKDTNGKIPELLQQGDVRSNTRLVLTNAVYFKGDWTSPFQSKATKVEDFHLSGHQTVEVPLMHRNGTFRYAAVDGLQMLELPYGDRSLAMVVLLPADADGLSQLEARLTSDAWQQWDSQLRSQEVVVYLPKFKSTAQFELNESLKSLGMPSAFDPSSADFSGMTGGRDLFISKVVHKAFVDGNEEGTEAAAATGVIMAPTAMPQPKPKPIFRADHPFVFLIRDNRNGTILFLGRFTQP